MIEMEKRNKYIGLLKNNISCSVPLGYEPKQTVGHGKLTGPWRLQSSRSMLPREFLDSGFWREHRTEGQRTSRLQRTTFQNHNLKDLNNYIYQWNHPYSSLEIEY